MLLAGLTTVLITSAPGPNLVPSMAFLTATDAALPAQSPPKPEHHFETGWLIAGIAGGVATGSLIGEDILNGRQCDSSSSHGPAPAAVVFVWNAGIGTGLGYAAAKTGGTGWKVGVVLYDILGPSIALLGRAFDCAHY